MKVKDLIDHLSSCPDDKDTVFLRPQEAYAALIDKISSKGTWERNPNVFVYDIELVD